MLIHIFLLIYICVVAIPVFNINRLSYSSRKIVYVILTFLPMIFIAGVRKETVGLDTVVYKEAYYKINSKINSWEAQNWEKGFVILNRVIGSISPINVQMFFACISAVIMFGCGIFIIRNSEDISTFFPVFLFVTLNNYFASMVSLRQYIALAIGINSYTILKKDSSSIGCIKSIVIILIAIAFHKSAFVLFTIPVLFCIKRINRKTVVFIALLGFLSYLFFNPLMDCLLRVFSGFARYKVNGNIKFEGVKFGKVYMVLLIVKIIIAVCIFTLNPSNKKNRELYILLILNIISIIISTLTTRVALVWRLGYYFDIMIILLLPKIIHRISGIKKMPEIVVFTSGIIYFMYLCIVNTSGCIPYLFYWQ